jgi:hypothetical protein
VYVQWFVCNGARLWCYEKSFNTHDDHDDDSDCDDCDLKGFGCVQDKPPTPIAPIGFVPPFIENAPAFYTYTKKFAGGAKHACVQVAQRPPPLSKWL